MIKHQFFNAAESENSLLLPRKMLVTNLQDVQDASGQVSEKLQKLLGSQDIGVKLALRPTWHDWSTQWGDDVDWVSMESHARKSRGCYALALYHQDKLCGLALNSFAQISRTAKKGTDIENIQTVDTILEYVEASPDRTPLSGYVFACLAEATYSIACQQHADRLVISHVQSLAVEKHFPLLGFQEDPYAVDLDVYLDVSAGDCVNWGRFLNHKQNRRQCSPQPHSI